MDALITAGVSDNGINEDTLMNTTMVTQSPPSFTDNDESFTTQSSTEEVNALLMLSQQPSTEGTTTEPKATALSLNMSSDTPAPSKVYKLSPPPSEKEKFSCAEILAGMQATWEVAEEVTTDINASLKPQPRKRGRPRKNPDAPPKVKRPRGRPRKDGTPPVQRKDNDKAAEMLLMLHLQGSKEEEDSSDDEHLEHPTKYANYSKKVVNVGGIKAVASNANMTTRQGSRHGKKIFNNQGGQQDAVSPHPEKKKARMVATRPNNKRKAPANVKLSASNINSRVKKRINAGKESKAVKDRINKASQIVNSRYGEPGPARQKKLRALIVRGITCRPSGKWQAQVYYNRKSRYLGVYDSKESAALAYEVAREVLRTDESWGTDLCTHNVNDAKKTNEEIGIARKAAMAIITGSAFSRAGITK